MVRYVSFAGRTMANGIRLFQYFPFTPFFILFSNVVRNPEQRSSRDDFELMGHVVSYLERMKAANENASKLHKIAAAFTQIAAAFLQKFVEVPEMRLKRKISDNEVPQYTKKLKRTDTSGNTSDVSSPAVQSSVDPALQDFSSQHQPDVSNLFPHAFNFLRWSNNGGRPRSSSGVIQNNNNNDAQEGNARIGSSNTTFNSTATSAPVPVLEGFDFDIEALMAEPVDFQSQMQEAHRQGPLDFDWFQWDQYTQGLGDSPGQSAYATLPLLNPGGMGR